jgi:hypothetical protein
MSDGKETKILILNDLHDIKVDDFSKLEGIGKQWFEHCVGNNGLEVHIGAVFCAKEFEKITKKEQDNEQNANQD